MHQVQSDDDCDCPLFAEEANSLTILCSSAPRDSGVMLSSRVSARKAEMSEVRVEISIYLTI